MTKLLISRENPTGYTLEQVIRLIRNDVLQRCLDMSEDPHPDVQEVISNNMHILALMEQIIAHAEGSSEVLKRRYGKTQG